MKIYKSFSILLLTVSVVLIGGIIIVMLAGEATGQYNLLSIWTYFFDNTTSDAIRMRPAAYDSTAATGLYSELGIANAVRNSTDPAMNVSFTGEYIETTSTAINLNPDNGNIDLIVEGDTATDTKLFIVDASTGRIGISAGFANDPDRLGHIAIYDNASGVVTNVMRLTHETSATAANGLGIGEEFEIETAAGNEIGAIREVVVTDTTSASEDVDYLWKLMDAGAAASERMRLTSDGVLDVSGYTNSSGVVSNQLLITHNTSATPAIGLGVGIGMVTETTAGEETGTVIESVVTDETSATEDFDLVVKLMDEGAAAAERFRLTSAGVTDISGYDNASGAVTNLLLITHNTSATPANGLGVGVAMIAETAADNEETGVVIEGVIADNTDASEDFDFIVKNMAAGAAATETFRVESTGVTSQTQTGTVKRHVYQADAMADDGTHDLPDQTAGMVMVTANDEGGMWLIETDGTVTKVSGTTNTVATDTDANLCVYKNSSTGVVKNRLGSTAEARVYYFYN